MRVEITEKGVYDVKGQRVAVGTEIDVKGDVLPAWLVNKVRVISADRTAVTNPANGALPAKTVVEVLAMAEDGTHFQTFKAEAVKILGDNTPSTKDEIVKALEETATKPE